MDAAADADAPADDEEGFVRLRPRLVGIAYRVLGTTADADDVVQEAWFRWRRADRAAIDNVDAWLTTVVTRLALDRLRRRKREEDRYVGPWLPAPLVERSADPAASVELAESMTMAFLLLLERLSPDERAAFLLADVFAEPYDVIATAMDRSEAACRQLASRGRRKLHEAREPAVATDVRGRSVVDRFVTAIATGDEATALACVADDARLIGDGGAKQRSARRPVIGPRRIVRFLGGLQHRLEPGWGVEPATVGGLPGFVVTTGDGTPFMAIAIEVVDDAIRRLLLVSNPDKLDAVDRPPSWIA